MSHADGPFDTPPDFSTMTTEEVVAWFARYDYRDDLGHPLTLCQDFLDLISLATFAVTP